MARKERADSPNSCAKASAAAVTTSADCSAASTGIDRHEEQVRRAEYRGRSILANKVEQRFELAGVYGT